MTRTTLLLALVSLPFLGCAKPAATAPAVNFEATARPLFSGMESSSPQVAISDNDTLAVLALTGSAPRAQLTLALSHDGGDSFSPSLPVTAPGATIMARGEMAPVLRVQGGNAFVLWEQSPASGPTELLVSHSADGRAFASPSDVVPAVDQNFRGFANLSAPVGKTLYAVWLDGRDPHRPQGTFDVYLARSDDQGTHWSDGARVGTGGCPCCRPAVAADAHGNVYVAWRKVYPGDQRDLAMSVSHDGGKAFAEPLRVASEHWTLHACPESGPSLALTAEGRLAVAWFSGAGQPAVRIAVSSDGARTFHLAQVPATIADQNHPDLTLASDNSLWLTLQGRAASTSHSWPPLSAFIFLVHPDGTLGAASPATGGILGYPQLAAAAGGRLFLVSSTETMGRRQVTLMRGRDALRP